MRCFHLADTFLLGELGEEFPMDVGRGLERRSAIHNNRLWLKKY